MTQEPRRSRSGRGGRLRRRRRQAAQDTTTEVVVVALLDHYLRHALLDHLLRLLPHHRLLAPGHLLHRDLLAHHYLLPHHRVHEVRGWLSHHDLLAHRGHDRVGLLRQRSLRRKSDPAPNKNSSVNFVPGLITSVSMPGRSRGQNSLSSFRRGGGRPFLLSLRGVLRLHRATAAARVVLGEDVVPAGRTGPISRAAL